MTPATGARPARELLARAASRQSVPPGDGRSGAAFERVTADGTAYLAGNKPSHAAPLCLVANPSYRV